MASRFKERDEDTPEYIVPNYLTHEDDIKVAVAAFRAVRQIVHTNPFFEIHAEEVSPGTEIESTVDIRKWLLANARSLQDLTGTCAFGAKDSDVLDPRLNVRGVTGVRVADASVLPNVPIGRPLGSTYAIGQKAADFLIEDMPVADGSVADQRSQKARTRDKQHFCQESTCTGGIDPRGGLLPMEIKKSPNEYIAKCGLLPSTKCMCHCWYRPTPPPTPAVPTPAPPVSTRVEFADYVIVGAGSAGSLIASRFAKTGKSTMILEAGRTAPTGALQLPTARYLGADQQGPMTAARLQYFMKEMQGYETYSVPASGANSGNNSFMQGAGLGGTSALSYGWYSRSSQAYWDNLAQGLTEQFGKNSKAELVSEAQHEWSWSAMRKVGGDTIICAILSKSCIAFRFSTK